MSKIKLIFVILFAGLAIVCSKNQKSPEISSIDFTWMANTNWLIETEEVRILLDGWITRIPRPARPDIQNLETLSVPPIVPDTTSVKRVFKAISEDKKIDYIISGHSHFDHSFDTALWAKLTGAHIIGPKSTCLQAFAQDIPNSQYTIVKGGETIDLGGGMSVRVIRWNHSGNTNTPVGLLLQTPMALVDVPKPDPATGGLQWGILQDGPVGNCLAFLFTQDHPEHPFTWFWANSGNAQTFTESKIMDEAFMKKYNIKLNKLEILPQEKSIEEYLIEATKAEKLDSIDLLVGYNNSYHVEQLIPFLKPKAFIPQHWGGMWKPFLEGIEYSYSNQRLDSLLTANNIHFYPQKQYMDKFRLVKNGVIPIPNDVVKTQLGFQD